MGLLDNSVLGFNCVSFDLALFAACGCGLMIWCVLRVLCSVWFGG